MAELLFSPGIMGLVIGMFSLIMLVSLSAWLTERKPSAKRKSWRRQSKKPYGTR